MNVPSVTAISVVSAAIESDVVNADCRPSTPNGSFQCFSVKPCQVKLKRPLLSLNENRTITKIGMNR